MKPTPSEQALFAEALSRNTHEARAAYLNAACGMDVALRHRVEALLHAAERAGDFLEVPPTGLGGDTTSTLLPDLPSEKAGDRIGRYKLLQQIGEGGCGVVYMAEQEEPVRRRVALKVIKLGMDTKSVIARFEAERQALAMMDHPNIAKVLDAGATETGRPYFVMEPVRGIKITDYCDQNHLPTDGRLRLFTQVCHAIQHAHQKGIIHRDIKPSNILVAVSEPGSPGAPKVIDFGIAKATTGQRLTDKTVFTAFEQFIGTPAYMSPEQAMMTSLDIDTRTDIYALGVLLYELLTGTTPFDADDLMAAGLDAMRRTIREQEPPKPSTRLSTLMEADLSAVAKHRHAEPAKLGTLLRGDLDWIVMKALDKDRSRRYETANGLALDIERHLSHEPVIARPPSASYQFHKLVRRNKLTFGAIAAVTTALMIGIAASAWQALRARRAEREQVKLRQQAEADKKMAQNEAVRSRQVARFMKDVLTGVGPSVALGRDTAMLKDILDKTAGRLGKDLSEQPDVEAELRHTIGSVYHDLGEFTKAAAMHREALAIRRKLLGNEHLDVAASLALLGNACYGETKFAEAEAIQREALQIRRKLLGSEHVSVAQSLNDLANMLRAQGKLPEAETLHREALALYKKLLGDDNPAVAAVLKNLALGVVRQSRLEEGAQLHREALAMRRKHFGPEHPAVADSLNAVAGILQLQGKLAEAEALFREVVAMRRKWDADNPDVGRALFQLAVVLSTEYKLAEAEALYREVLVIFRKRLGEEHPDVVEQSTRLVFVLCRQGKLAQAEGVLRDVIRQVETHPTTAFKTTDQWMYLGRLHNQLGLLLRNGGRQPEAAVAFRKAQELWRQHTDPTLAQAEQDAAAQPGEIALHRWHSLMETYYDVGDWDNSLRMFRNKQQVIATLKWGFSGWEGFFAAMACSQLNRPAEARQWFAQSIGWMDSVQESRLRDRQAEAAFTLGLPDPGPRSERALACVNQGKALQGKGESAAAQAAYDQAIQLYQTLAADFPEVAAYQRRLTGLSGKGSRSVPSGASGSEKAPGAGTP